MMMGKKDKSNRMRNSAMAHFSELTKATPLQIPSCVFFYNHADLCLCLCFLMQLMV